MTRREGYRPLTVPADVRRVTRLELRHGRIVLHCEGEPGVVRVLPPEPVR